MGTPENQILDSLEGGIDRAPRLHVRIPCELIIQDTRISASSSNISVSGLYVRAPQPAMSKLTLTPGTLIGVTLQLPHVASPLVLTAEVRWLNPNDFDVGCRNAVGLGLKILSPSEDTRTRLAELVKTFRYTILVLVEDEGTRVMIEKALSSGYRLITCDSIEETLDQLRQEQVALLITGQIALGGSAVDLLRCIGERLPFCHVLKVVVASYPETEKLKDFVNLGKIFHYLEQPFHPHDLRYVVQRAIDTYAVMVENERLNRELEQANQKLTREVSFLRKRMGGPGDQGTLIGKSPAFDKAIANLERIANSDAAVLIRGETGTGKEVIARDIHFRGSRKEGPFVPVNCGGLTETLIESTLFGHRKGSFTGAIHDHVGAFQRANGGTLFLDEVAEFPLEIQGSLLRVLQDSEITPVGATRSVQVEVRIISATHKDLKEEIRGGRFREDLYYRLVVFEVDLPPLRARREDIPLLAQHFLESYCERYSKALPGFSQEVIQVFERYPWPGNVRELENTLERMVVLAEEGQPIGIDKLPPDLGGAPSSAKVPSAAGSASAAGDSLLDQLRTDMEKSGGLRGILDKLERELVVDALSRSQGNQTVAARLLHIPRQTLQSRLQKFGL